MSVPGEVSPGVESESYVLEEPSWTTTRDLRFDPAAVNGPPAPAPGSAGNEQPPEPRRSAGRPVQYRLADLARAVRAGDMATIGTYLAQGGNPNVTDSTGITLLHLAAKER